MKPQEKSYVLDFKYCGFSCFLYFNEDILLPKYYYSEQIKEDKMCRMCGMYGEECMQHFGGETGGKRPTGRPRHRWEGNIKFHFKQLERAWTGVIWLRRWVSDDVSERGNKLMVFICQQRNCLVHKKDSVHCSYILMKTDILWELYFIEQDRGMHVLRCVHKICKKWD